MIPDGTGAVFVDFTVDMESSSILADKTPLEIYNTVKTGGFVYGRLHSGSTIEFLPLSASNPTFAYFSMMTIGDDGFTVGAISIDEGEGVVLKSTTLDLPS